MRSMRHVLVVSALAIALAGAEARAQCTTAVWLSDPPTKVYRDGNLRFHFQTAGFRCDDKVSAMAGTHVSPVGVECEVSDHPKMLESIQDWRPVSGTWGTARTFSLSLATSGVDGTCYDEATGADPLSIEVLDTPVPPAQKVAVTVKDAIIAYNCQAYIGLGITPVDRETIYWVTVKMQDYDETLPYIVDLRPPPPLPDGPNAENIVYVELHKGGCHSDQCNLVFQTELCTPISITVRAEDLAGRIADASEAVIVTIGNPTGTNTWRLGDPLGCDGYDAGYFDVPVFDGGPGDTYDGGSPDGGDGQDIGDTTFDAGNGGGGSQDAALGSEPANDDGTACSCTTVSLE